MTPEKFGSSLLIHLDLSYGFKAILEAECVFYGQTKDGSQQAAVIQTKANKGDNEIVRCHFYTDQVEAAAGVIGHTSVCDQTSQEPCVLVGSEGHGAVVYPNGSIVVRLGEEVISNYQNSTGQ